jgi:pyruvate, water dikinase
VSLKQLFKYWTYQVFSPGALLREKYNAFKTLLRHDDIGLEVIADLEEVHYGREKADWARIEWFYARLSNSTQAMVEQLGLMRPSRYLDLMEYFRKIDFYIRFALDTPKPDPGPPYVLPLENATEHPLLTGGKSAALSTVAKLPGIKTPDGVIVTVNAFHYLMEFNELRPRLNKLLRQLVLHQPDSIEESAAALQECILQAEIPEILAQEITEAIAELLYSLDYAEPRLAIRSSALAEDGEISFAGQYSSVLDVHPRTVLDAYKKVIASKYSAKAITYRIFNGYADQETPMAVLVMPMVKAESAGVVYTRENASTARKSELCIYSVPGQGAMLVDGSVRPERRCFDRQELMEHAVTEATAAVPDNEQAIAMDPYPTLALQALRIEDHFGVPQDIEWAIDATGTPYILQTRPLLQNEPEHARPSGDTGEATAARPEPEDAPLFSGGECASHGVGAGPVFHLNSIMDVSSITQGAVLVVPTLSPSLARIVDRVSAVVSRSGSRASHFASVAREYGLPVLTGVEEPFALCAEGEKLTVDATGQRIFKGVRDALVASGNARRIERESPVSRRLDKVMPFISRLTLTDPESSWFTPENCKSLHDIVRFAHEKSVAEMFSLVSKGGRGLSRAKRLKSHLPISIFVLDLGGGLFEAAKSKDEVRPDDIQSLPMWAFWFGISAEDVQWNKELLHVDWEQLDRIAAGIFKRDSMLLSSYAVISKDYLHMMIRFGYHFSVLDSICGTESKNNYINLRFKGGGAEFDQRVLRLEFLKAVLEHFDFSVTIRGDLLDAGLWRESESTTQKRLASIGYLLARTRLMDMALQGEDQVQKLVQECIDRLQQ